MIDARTQHDPSRAADLIAAAINVAGTQRELAARLDVSPRYLQMCSKGDKQMSYGIQVMLESVLNEK